MTFKEYPHNKNYYVSNEGDIFSKKLRRRLKPTPQSKGYMRVTLSNNGIRKEKYVHRMVIETFENEFITKDDQINHKNKDKRNNKIDNLEIMTLWENIKHRDYKEEPF